MSTHAHVYNGTGPVVTTALIHRLLTKNMFQEGHELVVRVSLRSDKGELIFEIRFPKAIRRYRQIISAMGNASYYVCGPKPLIRREMLEGL